MTEFVLMIAVKLVPPKAAALAQAFVQQTGLGTIKLFTAVIVAVSRKAEGALLQ